MTEPSHDELGNALSIAVLRFHDAIATALQLNVSEHKALDLIIYRPGATAGTISESLGVTPAAATKIVQSLLARGYISRERDAADARRFLLRPSAASAAAMARIYGPLHVRMQEFMSSVSPDVAAGILAWITIMIEGLDDGRDGVAEHQPVA